MVNLEREFRVVSTARSDASSSNVIRNYGSLENTFLSVSNFSEPTGQSRVFVEDNTEDTYCPLFVYGDSVFYPGLIEIYPSTHSVYSSILEGYTDYSSYNVIELSRSGQVLAGPGIDSDTFDNDVASFLTVWTYDREVDRLISILRSPGFAYGTGAISNEENVVISDTTSISVKDLSPFIATNLSPASGAILVNPSTNVTFMLYDGITGIDKTSLDITVGSEVLVLDGSIQTSSSWSLEIDEAETNDSITYLFIPSGTFTLGSVVDVHIAGLDLASPSANLSVIDYSFQVWDEASLNASITILPDTDYPYLSSLSPASGSDTIGVCSAIEFSILDDTTGVDLSSVIFEFDGYTVYSGGLVTDSGTLTITPVDSGYGFSYEPSEDLEFGRQYCVGIQATDLYSLDLHTSAFEYCFTTVDNSTLSIEDFFLGVGDMVPVLSGTTISVKVLDPTWGVSTSGTHFVVDGVEITPSFSPISGGYLCSYQPPDLFDRPNIMDVVVHGQNNRSVDCAVYKEETYGLAFGYRVFSFTDTPYEYGQQVVQLISVGTEVENVSTYHEPFLFTTHGMSHSDLQATIDTGTRTSDLLATIYPLGPAYYYNKRMKVRLEASDLEGNELEPLEFYFRIERKPT